MKNSSCRKTDTAKRSNTAENRLKLESLYRSSIISSHLHKIDNHFRARNMEPPNNPAPGPSCLTEDELYTDNTIPSAEFIQLWNQKQEDRFDSYNI